MNAFKPKYNWDLKPAKLENVPVWLGIAGPSSSGKTYSALLVATGMQEIKGGDIAVIDTENRRATHYAKQFKFLHQEFDPPFSAERYLDAARYVASKGCKIIVVDSMSHEHEGEGGYLLSHKDILDTMVARGLKRQGESRSEWALREAMSYSAWIEPAAARTYMVQQLLQIDASFIFCFRAKDKLKIVKERGKNVPKSQGFMPIAGDELVYNCAALTILPPRSKGVPDWESKGCKVNTGMEQFFPRRMALAKDTGRWLQQWATGADVEVKWTPPPEDEPQQQYQRRGGNARRSGPAVDDGDPYGDYDGPPTSGPLGPEPPVGNGAAGQPEQRQPIGQGSLLGDDDPAAQTRRQTQAEAKRVIAKFSEAADDLGLDMAMHDEAAALAKIKEASQTAYEHVMSKATERRTAIAQQKAA